MRRQINAWAERDSVVAKVLVTNVSLHPQTHDGDDESNALCATSIR